ncbi:MAG: NAD(P)H-hydrate epimerase [Planctomycetaceae bacterium]
MRELDRRAIDEFGMAGVVLMENAGRGVCDILVQASVTGPVVICAGKGNNGGDGLVLARHLDNRGVPVSVLLCCDPTTLRGDALCNYQILHAASVPIRVVAADEMSRGRLPELNSAEWVVDAVLGTGTVGDIREPFVAVIDAINAATGHVLAIDLPSGMDCDTGRSLNACVRADRTATLVAAKLGFRDPISREWTGEVHVVDIGIPRRLLETHVWDLS